MRYDVIVVGARVAGSATAMLLARQGLRVLAVDRVSLPSDTISSHQIQLPGVALLHRWGLLDRVRDSGAPPTRDIRFDTPDVVLRGTFPIHEGVDALYSPRRTVLDGILVDAARAAGAEVRENFRVEELVWTDGRVTGIRGSARRGQSIVETARLVVGADGKRSTVASLAGAAHYRQHPVRAFASYTYWAGAPVTGGAIYQRPQRTVAVFPTNDNLTMVYVAAPLTEFGTFREDIETHYLSTLDRCGDLGERIRGASRAERIRTTPDQPHTFRRSHGPGWALVGDAGVVMDSITAQGISNALRDAQLLADAIIAGLSGAQSSVAGLHYADPLDVALAEHRRRRHRASDLRDADPLDVALAEHQRRRDRAIGPMFDFTARLTRFRPRLAEKVLLTALRDRPAEISRFLGAIAGAEPVNRFFGPLNALRLIASSRRRAIRPGVACQGAKS